MVQWLKLCSPNAGGSGSIPCQGTRSHMLRLNILHATTKTWYSKMLCYAKSLQSCPTLCDPINGSPPGSPSLGFSRQEHWSGLPFPSPMHESEKWKRSRSVVSDSSGPHGLQPIGLLHSWDFPGKSTGVGCHCLLRSFLLVWTNNHVFQVFITNDIIGHWTR